MNVDLLDKNLTQFEIEEINKLLSRQCKGLSDLEQIWYLMDIVWDDSGCDNRLLNWVKIANFYSHPVWLLNGFFIEQDEVSMQHRESISNWVVRNGFQDVIDYGGGFGTLARLIAIKNNKIKVDVYEPHPSDFSLKRIAEFDNIKLIPNLIKQYDCMVSTDVLEHVPDPLKNLSEMINCIKLDGYLVVANAFFPMIKCHLPQTFHFRYSFSFFAKCMGLERIDILDGSHAMIYKKVKKVKLNWYLIRFFEKFSEIVFYFLERLKKIIQFFRRNLNK